MKHLSLDLIVRAIDDELALSERIEVEEHLSVCQECRQQQRELGGMAIRIEQAVLTTPLSVGFDHREAMETKLAAAPVRQLAPSNRARLAGWASAVAAALVLAALAPRFFVHKSQPAAAFAGPSAPATVELDGETFVVLPYSNPDLPSNSGHVVQMQVPVSSLADAGVLPGPVSPAAADASVLADVLLGEDGEPKAVHVLSE